MDKMDHKIYYNLRKFRINKDDIVAKDRRIDLLEVCNISTGGTPWDCTKLIHKDFHAYCSKIMKILNLRFAGIDILSPDISLSPEEAYVLEVNASPDLEGFAKIGDIQFKKIEKLADDIIKNMGVKFYEL